MDKNTIWGFVLIAVILFGFTFYQSKVAQRTMEEQAKQDSIEIALGLKPDPVKEAARLDSLAIAAADATDSALVAQGNGIASVYKDTCLDSASKAEAQILALENDKVRIEFTSKGAQPWSVNLKDYRNYDSTALYLFKPEGCEYNIKIYAGEYIQTKDFNFDVAEHTDSSVVFRLPFSNGGYIEQKYTLSHDSYDVSNVLSFVGLEGVIPKNVGMFDIDFSAVIPRMEKGYKNESQYSKLDYYFQGDKKPEEMGRGRNSNKRIDSRLSWFAFQQQFFSVIMRAEDQFSSGELSVNFFGDGSADHNLMACSAVMRSEIDPLKDNAIPFQFYFGPNSYKILQTYDQKYEKIIPLGGWLVGWFTRFVIIPLFDWLSRYISSYGLIILLMTIIIKTVVFPLTYKSYASSAKMQALRPELEKINAKYPNQEDAMKKQQATMDLYKRADVSMMGGCLPTLLTFPILWAMFRFFPASIELRQQPFLWCHDLSAYDSIIDYGTKIPIFGDHLSLFALLMAITMWGYSKMTMANQPTSDDPNAASMKFMSLWMMPIMMFFICNSLSAALSYYYLLSQLIAIIQAWVIRKTINKDAILAKVRASEGKPLPKSKWQQRLEEAQKMQEKQLKEQQRKRR